jgi:hypothetical protein
MAIDWTKPLQTKDGMPVRYLGTIKGEHRIVVAVDVGEKELVWHVPEDGRNALNPNNSIVNAPLPPRDLWVNVYRNVHGQLVYGIPRESREEADSHPNCHNRIACAHFTYTEGEGL